MRPLFHESTREDLLLLAGHLPHAIGLHGSKGAGLTTAATFLSQEAKAELELVYPERNETVDLEKGKITIDIIRRLYQTTQTKFRTQKIIVLVAADTMTLDAQNAFLKLLEEPANNVSFVLLVHTVDRLLPTIKSRLQLHEIRPVTRVQSEQLLDRLKIGDEVLRRQLLFLASGRPALLTKLSQDKKMFQEQSDLLKKARDFIQATTYRRLVIAHEMRESREKAIQLIDYAMTLLRFDITSKQQADQNTIALLERLEGALTSLNENGNIRLVLAKAAF